MIQRRIARRPEVRCRLPKWHMTIGETAGRVPVVYIIIVLGLSLLLGGGMYSTWLQLLGILFTVPALLAVLLWWSRHSGGGMDPMHDLLVIWPCIGILVLAISLGISVYKWVSLVELCKGISLAALFWFSRVYLSHARQRRTVMLAIFGIGILYAGAGLFLYSVRTSADRPITWLISHLAVLDDKRLSIGFAYANTFAAFLLVPISIGMGLAVTEKTVFKRILACAGTLLLIGALIASTSRGGLLVLMLLILIAPILLAHAEGGHTSWKWALWLYGGLFAAVVAAFIIPVIRQNIINPLITRLAKLTADIRSGNILDSESLGGRLTMVLDGFRYMRAYPVLGSGAGTYASVYMQFRSTMFFSSDPHSFVIKTLTETGLVGLAALCGLVSTAVWRWWSAARAQKDGRILNVALLAGTAALLMHACIDWDLAFFSLSILLAVCTGMGTGGGDPVANAEVSRVSSSMDHTCIDQHSRLESVGTPRARCTRTIIWVLAGSWMIASALLASAGTLQEIATRQRSSDPEAALKKLTIVSVLDPLNAEAAYRRAEIGAAQDVALSTGPLSDKALSVRSDFEHAIQLNKHYPEYRIAYGRYLLGYRLADAVQLYEGLIPIDPRDPGVYTGLAASYLTAYDNVEKAQQSLTRALTIDSGYGEAHLVQGMLFERQKRYEQAAAEYRHAADLDTLSSTPLISLGNMRENQGKTRAAIRAFFEAYQRTPDDASVHARLASMAPIIDITTPSMDTSVIHGQALLVQWIVSGKAADAEEWNISLTSRRGTSVNIVAGLKGVDRSWAWKVPADQKTGAYRLTVYARAPSEPADASGDWLTYASSDWFTIR